MAHQPHHSPSGQKSSPARAIGGDGSPHSPSRSAASTASTSSNTPLATSHSNSTTKHHKPWEPGIAKRIHDIVEATEATSSELDPYPYCVVALVGVPGAHRTLSAFLLQNILEESYGIESMILPASGYHYPIQHLKSFPDAEQAIYRRGAPETLDPHALWRDLKLIKGDADAVSAYYAGLPHKEEDLATLHFPGFDHAHADPQPDKHTFDRNRHKVVIVEGKYLLHDQDGWEDLREQFDLTVFMDSDVEECLQRLKIRNLCIPGYSPEEMALRCDTVDRANAQIVLQSRQHADVIVQTHMAPLTASDQPEEPSLQLAALTLVEQKAYDNVQEENDNADWTMDIHSRRPRGDSFQILSRSNSFVSTKSTTRSEVPPPPAAQFVGTWEPDVAQQIQDAIEKRLAAGESEKDIYPYMVALVGTPGSGKSVSSFMLASQLDDKGLSCMVCPHDGYHYPLQHLRTFPDADDFVYRRGAPDTFDPRALYRDLDRIKHDTVGDEVVIKLPAFDHATADPEPDTHIFDRNFHKVVLCEGLYLLHDQDGWEEIASLFDLKIFMNSDIDVCIERVKVRNRCIPGYTPEEIDIRCEKVDRVNALTVLRSKYRADIVVDSSAIKK